MSLFVYIIDNFFYIFEHCPERRHRWLWTLPRAAGEVMLDELAGMRCDS